MNLVPATSEITAVTSKSCIAALNIPVGTKGILVFSEISFIILFISSLVRINGVASILPPLLTKTLLAGPGHSTLAIVGSSNKAVIFPRFTPSRTGP